MASPIQEAMEIEKNYMKLTGFYPVKERKFLYICLAIANVFISLSQFITMMTLLFLSLDNIEKLTEIALFSMTQFAYLLKLFNFALKRNNLFLVERFINSSIFNEWSLDQKKALTEDLRSCQAVAKLFRVLCICVVLFYALYPFLDKDLGVPLPLPGWFPFDIREYYYETFSYQIISIAMGAFTNSGIDILTYTLMQFAKMQFMLIRDNIIHLGDFKSEENVKKQLKKCIVHHNDVIKFVSLIEDLFSSGIFMQFLLSVIVICMTGFQMIMVPLKSVKFLLLIVYFSCMMCQVATYCWYGNEIILTSTQVSGACFESSWEEFDIETRKFLMFVIARSQKPVRVTATKFFSLSLTTLMTILRSSYSYFALLQRLYSEENMEIKTQIN